MKPLVVKPQVLRKDVDYIFYCVYPKGEENPLADKLFICEWDPSIKLTCEYNEETGFYEWFRIEEAYKPFVYYANENETYGYDKDIVLPYILEENILDEQDDESNELKHYVQFLNEDKEREILPDYMNAVVNKWMPNVSYKLNDKVSYNEKIYKCLQNHISSDIFNESKWFDCGYLKNYQPYLPLYYGIPHSHDTILKTINAYEKEGHYWYGRKFIFYEVHFSFKFKNNIDNFTIDFYNDINDNSPEFLLI